MEKIWRPCGSIFFLSLHIPMEIEDSNFVFFETCIKCIRSSQMFNIVILPFQLACACYWHLLPKRLPQKCWTGVCLYCNIIDVKMSLQIPFFFGQKKAQKAAGKINVFIDSFVQRTSQHHEILLPVENLLFVRRPRGSGEAKHLLGRVRGRHPKKSVAPKTGSRESGEHDPVAGRSSTVPVAEYKGWRM